MLEAMAVIRLSWIPEAARKPSNMIMVRDRGSSDTTVCRTRREATKSIKRTRANAAPKERTWAWRTSRAISSHSTGIPVSTRISSCAAAKSSQLLRSSVEKSPGRRTKRTPSEETMLLNNQEPRHLLRRYSRDNVRRREHPPHARQLLHLPGNPRDLLQLPSSGAGIQHELPHQRRRPAKQFLHAGKILPYGVVILEEEELIRIHSETRDKDQAKDHDSQGKDPRHPAPDRQRLDHTREP